MTRDAEGHRTYTICWKLTTDSKDDGPLTVLACPSLPYPGQFWYFGNDADPYAFCLPPCSVKKNPSVKEDNPFMDWIVEQTFSTKPVGSSQQRDPNTPVEDPLLEPQKVSGSFVQYTEEGTQDRFGSPIVNSAWERIRGPQNEWEANRNSIEIEQNVPDLQLALVTAIGNSPLNNAPLWGCPARSIKLSRFSWERKFFSNSYVYYTRKLGFDVRVKTDPQTGRTVGDWDRDITDEGTKVLSGHWDKVSSSATFGQWVLDTVGGATPDPYNPQHFIRFQDKLGNYANVMLDGRGQPAGGSATPKVGPYVMSIRAASSHDPGDTNNPDNWVVLRSNPASIIAYEGLTTYYARGVLRTYGGFTWVQTNPNGSNSGVPGTNGDWTNVTPNDRGAYDIDQYNTYAVGDYVTLVTQIYTGVGRVHVEKYGESNLLLLNIPLTF